MGYITRLPTAGLTALPTLGDIGFISKVNLKGLYLINGGTGLTDSSGNGANLSLLAGTVTPPYSAGVLQFRFVANGQQQLTTGVPIAGANQTIIFAYKKTAAGNAGGQLIASHVSGGISASSTNPMAIWDDGASHLNWGQQTKRPTITHAPVGNAVGQWNMWAGTRDANGISLSINGQAPVTIAYNTADPGSTTSNNVVIGDTTANTRMLEGDLGFFALYDRAMAAAEIASVYKAVKRLMLAKGIAI